MPIYKKGENRQSFEIISSEQKVDPRYKPVVDKYIEVSKKCNKCPLVKSKLNYCIWKGTLPCDILFVGEGPDLSSDSTGVPYVGPTSRIFNDILERIGSKLERRIRWCVTYAVRCATPDYRSLRKGESDQCSTNLSSFINLAKPFIIVSMGEVAKKSIPDQRLVWPVSTLGERVTPHYFTLQQSEYRWIPERVHVKGITWIAKQPDYELAIKRTGDAVVEAIHSYGVPF